MKKISHSARYLYFAFVAELLLLIYFRNETGYIFSPLLLLLSGIFISAYPYFILKYNVQPVIRHQAKPKTTWMVFSGLSILYVIFSFFVFQANPIDVNHSDIIPFVRDILVKRALNGEPVYGVVHDFNNTYHRDFIPNYLPMQWGPFMVAGFLETDFRWVVVCVFILSVAYFIHEQLGGGISRQAILLHSVLPFVVLFSIYIKQAQGAAHTIEIMIMAYYLFLGVSLFSGNSFLRAIALLLPLMSRYSFLFWLPVCFFCLYKENTRRFFTVGSILAVLVLLLFILPVLIPNPGFLSSFNDIYLTGALGEWDGQSWQLPGDIPFQLFQGTGFASWFYMFAGGTLMNKILMLKSTLLIAGIASMVISFLGYRLATKVVSSQFYSLLTLKLCLTVFYAFILVPYVYLFWVPLMVSVVVLVKTENTITSQQQ